MGVDGEWAMEESPLMPCCLINVPSQYSTITPANDSDGEQKKLLFNCLIPKLIYPVSILL